MPVGSMPYLTRKGVPVATERSSDPPILLLDDVLSELDPARRLLLAERVRVAGQALITATDAAMLPADPDQLLEVTPGAAVEAGR